MEGDMVKVEHGSRAAEGEVLGIGEAAEVANDGATVAAQVVGRADVAGAATLWPVVADADRSARLEDPIAQHDATAAASSASVTTPFLTRLAAMERIHFS